MGRNRNNDDLDFDDDLFGDDDDDLFADRGAAGRGGRGGGDDFNGDDFDFGDDDDLDNGGLGLDDDDDIDLDELDNEEGTRSGPNRTFVILAVAMIILFLLGLGAVIFLIVSEGNGELDPTQVAGQTLAAQISTENAGTIVAATSTAVARATQAVVDQTSTAQALSLTQTAEAVGLTETAEFLTSEAAALVQQQTATAEAGFQQQTATAQGAILAQTATADFLTQSAGGDSVAQTQTAEALAGGGPVAQTQTAEALIGGVGEALAQTQTAQALGGGIDTGSVALTATAIANILRTPIVPVITGTPGGGPLPGGGGGENPPQVEMPNTGLFDDVGSGGMGTIMLVAVGLIGVIFGARRLRAMNAKRT
ncbi:MAG: hypothetical protein SF029_10435 [bacterium]|nr:hypothetical protein [bacterium]